MTLRPHRTNLLKLQKVINYKREGLPPGRRRRASLSAGEAPGPPQLTRRFSAFGIWAAPTFYLGPVPLACPCTAILYQVLATTTSIRIKYRLLPPLLAGEGRGEGRLKVVHRPPKPLTLALSQREREQKLGLLQALHPYPHPRHIAPHA